MTDFTKAFRQGQRAAVDARDARAQIDEVMTDFAQQLSRVTEGLISIELIADSAFSGLFTMAVRLGKLYDPSIDGDNIEKWIVARGSLVTEVRRLARWKRPHQGYPCLITYNGNEERCHDREALERGLASMLQDPWVGDQLRQLLELSKAAVTSPTEGEPPSNSVTE